MAPAAKHRESLLSASAALFQRQGYAATGLAEILSESGAPKGSLYHYFPEGKEAIAEEAMRTGGAAIEQRIRAGAARAPSLAAFVAAYANALATMMAESGFSLGCQIATVALEAAPQSARLTKACRDVLGAWTAAIADALSAAGIAAPRGTELAELMMCTFQGALILARVQQNTKPIANAAAELTRLFDMELRGTTQ